MSPRSRALFYALLFVHLVPIWSFDHLATQDGPSHLANASIMLRLWSGDCPIASEFYRFNPKLFPNWLGHLLLAGLGTLFPASLTEKLSQSIYVLLFALSMRLLILRIDPGNGFLCLAVFPLIYGYPFLMGFYGFSLGLAFFLFLLACWVGHRERLSHAKALLIALLGVAAFFSHPLPFAAACLFVVALAFSLALSDLAKRGGFRALSLGTIGRTLRGRLLVPLCALLPALLMFGIYLATSSAPGTWLWISFGDRVLKLLSGHALVAYSDAEFVFSIPVSLAILAMCAGALRVDARGAHPLAGGLLAVSGILVLAFFSAPDFSPRGGFISDRILLLLFLGLILWLATRRHSRRVAAAFQVAMAAGALGLLGVKVWKLAEVNSYLAEYLSAAAFIEEGHTLIPLNLLPGNALRHGEPSSRVDPLFHASNYIAAEKCVVSLNNYEAGYTDHFPILFREGLNPYAIAGYDEYLPERVDLRRYGARTGKPIDYVLAWGASEALTRADAGAKPGIRRKLRELRQGYDLLYRSGGRGLLRIYRRRDFGVRTPERGDR